MSDTPADLNTQINLNTQIKQGIVRSLRLPILWQDIDDAVPLFDGGLGLDSIDVLELVLEIERMFGVAITDEETGKQALRSVNTIAEFVRSRQSGTAG